VGASDAPSALTTVSLGSSACSRLLGLTGGRSISTGQILTYYLEPEFDMLRARLARLGSDQPPSGGFVGAPSCHFCV
jgi:hypothetical protein